MAGRTMAAIIFLVILACSIHMTRAADPEATVDFLAPAGAKIDANLFTFTGLRGDSGAAPGTVGIRPVFQSQLPVLQGLGISLVSFEFTAGSVIAPHSHPRGSEITYMIEGSLDVGFVDTNNRMFKQTLFPGDVFVFPEGLVHFQSNPSQFKARAISALSSSNPGLVSVPSTVFASGISADVLSKAFKVSPALVAQVGAALD